ncbi:hypothetical protein GCK72_006985 [Caenorhabditis remanei]|uniref:Uncharacterized protein n=1 Tax=Caenorhabditis remanei TaxID=31234 RepID=A0A6A5HKC8_CAERE|nr:hypothetical protein GCK72_006985 [Caenorhabditis remanei]KAF1767027.1 hypothetical protein GCK72_006985 [Caenorhabditis remanei]
MDRKSCPGCARTEFICSSHAKKMKTTFKEKEQQLEEEIKERDILIQEMWRVNQEQENRDFKKENEELKQEVKELKEKQTFAYVNYCEERRISDRDIQALERKIKNYEKKFKEITIVVESTIDEHAKKEQDLKDEIKELREKYIEEKTRFNEEKFDLIWKNAQLTQQIGRQQTELIQEKERLEWKVYNLEFELNTQQKREREWQLEKLQIDKSMCILAIELNAVIEKSEKIMQKKIADQNEKINKLESTLQLTGFKLTESHVQLKNYENREERHRKQNDGMFDTIQRQELEVIQLKSQIEQLETKMSEESQQFENSLKQANSQVQHFEEQLRDAESLLIEEQKKSAHTQELANQLWESDQWIDEKIEEMNTEKIATEEELNKVKTHFENYKKSIANDKQNNAQKVAVETGNLREEINNLKRKYNAMYAEYEEAKRLLSRHKMF